LSFLQGFLSVDLMIRFRANDGFDSGIFLDGAFRGTQFWATYVPKFGTLRKVAIRAAEYCLLV